MPPISLGHVHVLSHNKDVYSPSHVAHLLTTIPYHNLLPHSILNTPQKIYTQEKVGSLKAIEKENNDINEGIKIICAMK